MNISVTPAHELINIWSQVISRRDHGVAVDLWSYGVLLFEMMTSDLPFYHKNEKKMKEQITVRAEQYGS